MYITNYIEKLSFFFFAKQLALNKLCLVYKESLFGNIVFSTIIQARDKFILNISKKKGD